MIDPVHSLTFSMQATPGVYAVLLGSGVSRAAKIPTGWEITLDLIRKLAALHGETADPHPERWYQDTFKKEADYSTLLDVLAKTQSERQQLLRAYLEPNAQERENGEKQPTAAHRAIAELAVQRCVKVIITTNFDRLMERALEEAGIVPTVLSTPDHVKGALPLMHMQCCVLKVHGDYLDVRIRNTPAELDDYPPEFNCLLARIFDEFGLLVCGWSGDWDSALRNAIYRAPSRRFTTYWAARGDPGEEARKLITHRKAQVIPIEGADTFFQTVQQQVTAFEDFSRPHPLSMEAAVASLKRFLSESRYRIQLADLVDDAVGRIVERTSGEDFSAGEAEPTSETITARVRAYEAACSTLLAMATVGGRWAEEDHVPIWQHALQRLSEQTSLPGNGRRPPWHELQQYPATLLLYALGLGMTQAQRYQFLERVLSTKLVGEYREEKRAVRKLPPCALFDPQNPEIRLLEGMDRHPTPLNDWIHNTLRPHARRIIPGEERYTLLFDKLEILMELNCVYHDSLPLPGAFEYRYENSGRILREIRESLTARGDESPFVTCDIFGETAGRCRKELEKWEEWTAQWRKSELIYVSQWSRS